MVSMKSTTTNLLMPLVFSMMFVALPFAHGQDDTEADQEADAARLVRRLRNLNILQFSGDNQANIDRQRKRIDIANQILSHDFTEEPNRILAAITRLQAYGIHFAIVFKDKNDDQTLLDEYSAAIDEGLKDRDDRVAREATVAAASFRTALFKLGPEEVSADAAADALSNLNELAPKDPMIQATRRLMLEQIWESENADLVFELLKESDDEVASIALDYLNDKTDKEKAYFLWAKHFARIGDFVAQRRLASMYENGEGTRVSNSQAARWYTKLARVGDMHARIKLADFYLEGKGYSANPETAVKQYRSAANDRSRIAQFKLGQCYLNGTGVSQSDEKWQKWIKSAAFNASGADVQDIYTAIDFKDAADSFQLFYNSLVDQYPDDIYYLNNYAYSLLISKNKDPDKSLEVINKAIELAPEDFSGLNNFLDTKATALMQMEKWEEAAELFETVLAETKDKKPVLEALVKCHEKLESEKAKSFQKQLDDLNNDS